MLLFISQLTNNFLVLSPSFFSLTVLKHDIERRFISDIPLTLLSKWLIKFFAHHEFSLFFHIFTAADGQDENRHGPTN
ncbi:hypothetical protein ACOMICROBIO_GDFFDHBD_02687 [Vibrio sp. B1REV9]|nr:hypothetical protein ACOMICROBIO_GDFFDHBD_02687 [Vibrio sp. B1REV9]